MRTHCWCGEDLERNRHGVINNCCRICGNIEVKHHEWVRRQQDKMARRLPDEDVPPPLSGEEIRIAVTGRPINR